MNLTIIIKERKFKETKVQIIEKLKFKPYIKANYYA